MEKLVLKGLGRVLIVEDDLLKAEAFRQEIVGPVDEKTGKSINGNEAEILIVAFKFEAIFKLADPEYRSRFTFVLLDGHRMLYPDLAVVTICDDPGLFGG